MPAVSGSGRGMLKSVFDHRLWIAGVVLAMADCARPGEPGPPDPTAPAEGSPSTAEPQPPASALEKARRSVTVHMPEHFERAADLEQAVIRGDLRAAKASANELAQHRPDRYPEPWAPFVLRMRASAEAAARADDLDAMALATGETIGSCGACHEALGARVTLPVEPEPEVNDDDVTAVMKRHRWAATRLRAGVVEPSAQAWAQGVDAFGPLPSPTCPEDLGGERAVDVEALRDRFHVLQEEARAVERLEDRASAYGRLLGTCAGCHTGC